MTNRLALAARHRTLCISVHDDEQPAENFLPLKSSDYSSELIGLYEVIARLVSSPCSTASPA
jgi:hypothetical protein